MRSREPAGVAAAALRLWRDADLLVAKLPPGPPGIGQLRDILAARRAQDLVLVIQDPSHITRRLVAMGAAGLREARRSTPTRRVRRAS